MALWAQEHADGLELSDIPIETVKRGVESTQAFIESLKRTSQIVLRRKICLVGPSCAGKTSFVKSITTSEPQLEHVDNRTIGIDHYPLQFKQQANGRGKPKTHVVTFWDFAGQDAYQVAHSLFFSPRTLYFVCVDLEAFTIAYKQAVIFADDDSQEPKLLDEFFERSVRQWMRLIVARHAEAEFVFLATKEDLLHENAYLQNVLKQELQRRLQGVLTEVQAMKAAARDGPVLSAQDSRVHVTPIVVYVSCSSSASVQAARAQIERIIIKSNYSFPMTDEYSNVLNTILKIRDEAREDSICERITRTFAPVTQLLTELAALQIDSDLCSSILQILHDLGDVLWYEKLDIHRFRGTIILDPLLLIEFIRQVVTHEHVGVKMSHATLKAKPFWRNLGDDKELMKDMKQLMQSFHLVYSAAEDHVMDWDSELIVPAYWKTREPAAQRFPSGGLLTTMNGSSERDLPPRVRVHWDYHFECGLPPTLFDHFVVACVSPSFKFDAGPDWLLHYGKSGLTACRVMISRDTPSLHRVIHLEAVVADAATPAHEADLWSAFQRIARALVVILREHKGLRVSCFAWDDDGEDHNLKTLLRSKDARELPTWMPPVATWSALQL